MLNFNAGLDWSSGAATASNIFLILGTVLAIVWPIFLCRFLMKAHSKEKGFKNIKKKFRFLYSRLRTSKSSAAPMFAPLVFMAKRILFLVIAFYSKEVAIQIILVIALQFLSMVYAAAANPFATREQFAMEMFNEGTFMFLLYQLVVYTNYATKSQHPLLARLALRGCSPREHG